MDVTRPNQTVAITVRGLNRDIKARLQERAKDNGRSMEAEARDILEREARPAGIPLGHLSERAWQHLSTEAESSGRSIEAVAVEILERAAQRRDAAAIIHELTRKYGGFEVEPPARLIESHRIPEV